ncbi:MAG: DUF3857 domain-containing protein [Bacteroidales bacterium]|nr:MAG: DUF3857 domain-containing protein [Bacteroidales bacterium]
MLKSEVFTMNRYLSILLSFSLSLIFCNVLNAQHQEANQNGLYNKSIQDWEQQLINVEENIRDSKNLNEQHVLAGIYFYFNYYDKALDVLEEIFSKDSLSYDEIKMLAQLYYQKGNISESLNLYKKVFLINNSDFQAKHYIIKIANDLSLFNEDSSAIFENINKSISNFNDNSKENQTMILANSVLNNKKKDIERYVYSSAKDNKTIKKFKIGEIKDLNSEIKELIMADSIQLFDDEPAGVIDLKTNYTVTKDNRSIFSEHKILKINNESGKDTYSDIQIGYDASFQSLDIEKVRVYYNDGNVFEIPSYFIRTITPWTGSYSNYKIATINLPNIVLNSVIEYKYKLTNHHCLHPNDFQFEVNIQDDIPIINQKHEITHSKDKKLNLKYSESYRPIYSEDIDNSYYSWHVKNTKPLKIEKNSKIFDYLPFIKGSFFKSWREVYDWLKPYYLGSNLELSDDLKNFLKTLTRDVSDESEKVRLAYNWINENIRYIAIEIGQGGVYPRNANEIYNNRFGDCKDQSILLVSFLRELGIKAYPVLINTSPRVDMDTTLHNLEFTHCITYVELKNKNFFCDVIAKQTPFNYLHPVDQNRYCYVIKDENYKIMRTPISEPVENLELKEMKIQMLKNGDLRVEKNNYSFGENNTANKNYFIDKSKDEIKEVIQYDISYFCPGATLDKYEIQNLNIIDKPIIINETFFIPNGVIKISGGKWLFKIPTVYFSFDEVDMTERKYDLHYETTAQKKYNIEISIPQDYKIDRLPEDMIVKSDEVDFTYKYSLKYDKLNLLILYNRKGSEVKVEKYPEFKKYHDDISKKLQESIILQKR